jgi:DNA invertase Pin-like site-specific DNA recombinase
MSKLKENILYERLSAEDDRDGDSNSIISQRNLLEDYAERHGFTPYIHLTDDGYSGTDWSRPGWVELVNKIESGKVASVLVKDSSRIGRDFLRVGLFRELLRDKNVRLICVTDGFDSANGDDDFSPFRDLMAEWYARDISKKMSSSLRIKGRKGIPLSSRPPYGYIRDPQDKTRWLVDEPAAAIVRRIYNLTVDGKPPFEICRILHAEKVERPSYYLTKNGYGNYAGALEAENPYAWCEDNVKTILRREEYLGHVVNFRVKKASFKSKKQIFLPKEEWAIFENVHEPIVTKEVWDLVQELRKTKRRPDKFGEVSPLTGLIRCESCGSKMYHHRSKKGSHDYYECSNYSLSRQRFASDHCTPHSVPTKAIREILLDAIKRTAGFVQHHEKEFIQMVRENYSIKKGQTTKTHRSKIIKNERRIVELDKLFTAMYEDKVSGAISPERFAGMSAGYEKEQAALREENKSLQAEVDAFNEDNERADKFISLVQKYTRFEELTPSLINEFIDTIIIHEAEWSEATETNRRMGTRSQHIEVHLKYIGSFIVPDTRTAEEIEAERIAEEKAEARRKKQREYMRRKNAEKRAAESAKLNPTPPKTAKGKTQIPKAKTKKEPA